MVIEHQRIERWLYKSSKRIVPELKRQKLRLSCGDVRLGFEVYRSRWADMFYFEFTIYQRQLLDHELAYGATVPLFSRRLQNPKARDYSVIGTQISDPEFLQREIVQQGGALFRKIHSLADIARHYRGEIDDVPVDPIIQYNAPVIADRIEEILADAGRFPTS